MTAPSILNLAPAPDAGVLTAPSAIVPYGAHWAIDEGYAASALNILSRIDLVAAAAQPPVRPVRLTPTAQIAAWGGSSFPDADMDDSDDDDPDDRPYVRVGGTAIIAVEGPLTKRMTCMSWLLGGTSTVEARQAMRRVRQDFRAGKIKSLFAYFDSPGGQVAGTFDCADEFAACTAEMPTMAYVSDLCASAAYAIACMAGEVAANRSGIVGSIGTYMEVLDKSKMYSDAGVKVLVLRAGKFKGAGSAGTQITPEQLAEFQRTVDELNTQFLQTVARGRKMTPESIADLADGRVHVGSAAQQLGLIDLVADFDTALARLQARHGQPNKPRSAAPRGKENQMSKGLSVRERAAAYFAGLRASGAEMSEEDKKALANAEQSLETGAPAPPSSPPAPAAASATPATAAPAATDPAILAQMTAIQKQGEQLTALQQQMQEQIKLQQEQLAAARERENDAILMDMKRQGHLLPAAEEAAKKLLAADPDAFKAFLQNNGKVIAMAPNQRLAAKKPAGTVDGAAAATVAAGAEGNTQVLADMAMVRMKEAKIGYDVALKQIAKENPDLVAASESEWVA